ncbi:hypothetical protein AAG570_007104 [Ranatra chinensis]|uniref:Tim44-like domain-containing protein n=1 Tax=Ranatra chinensis TaxID=642074 RepID=A0ABD0XV73_9HEMI
MNVKKMCTLRSFISRTISILKPPNWHPPSGTFREHIKSCERSQSILGCARGGQFWNSYQRASDMKFQIGPHNLLQGSTSITCDWCTLVLNFLQTLLIPGGPDGVVVRMTDYHAIGPEFDFLRGQSWLKARLASRPLGVYYNVRYNSNDSSEMGKIVEKFQKAMNDASKLEDKLLEDVTLPVETLAELTQEDGRTAEGAEDATPQDEPEDKRDDALDDEPDDGIMHLTDGRQGEGASVKDRSPSDKKLLVGATPPRVPRLRSEPPPHTMPAPDKLESILGGRQFLEWKYLRDPRLFYTLGKLKRLDPTFTEEAFIEDCKHDFIPNIFYAIDKRDERLIDDWTTERARQEMKSLEEWAAIMDFHVTKRLIGVEDLKIVSGYRAAEGLVLRIAFKSREEVALRHSWGSDHPDTKRDVHVYSNQWDLMRDPAVEHPKAAWRLHSLG